MAQHPIRASCYACSYKNDSIPYIVVQNKDLTKTLAFKTNLQCPKCNEKPLVFKYEDDEGDNDEGNKPFTLPADISFHNIDSIIRKHLEKDSALRNKPPNPYNCGELFDQTTVATSTVIFTTCIDHNYDDCRNCKRVRRNRTLLFDDTTRLIKDSYGIVESVCQLLENSPSSSSSLSANDEKEEEENADECVICLDDISGGRGGRGGGKQCHVCNKRYHKSCIQKWIAENNCCPHCRSRIGKNLCFYFFKSKSFYTFDEDEIKDCEDDESQDDDDDSEDDDDNNIEDDDDNMDVEEEEQDRYSFPVPENFFLDSDDALDGFYTFSDMD